jgi:hypothetical protein
MATRRVAVHPVPGHHRSSARVLAYLVFEGDDTVDAARAIRRIDKARHKSGAEERNKVAGRFRHWLSGQKRHEYHHGWPDDPDFRMGYVFRWDHQRQHRRLYGFLTEARPGLQLCVLCCFRAKDTFRTEPAVKKLVRTMSHNPEVKEAVKHAFGRGRQESWRVQ